MLEKTRCLSGNVLKIIAAVCMVIDHAAILFFPRITALRIIGRLALPIFAFMISEGARYTKNKLRYFSLMFILAFICQTVYFFFDNGSTYMCILVTFSVAIPFIYVMQFVKAGILSPKSSNIVRIIYAATGVLAIFAVKAVNSFLTIDYGFWGCVLPAFASITDFNGMEIPKWLKDLNLDTLPVRVLFFSLGLILLAEDSQGVQIYSLFTVPLLFLYSEKRGRYKLKYFFYLFYPLHLVALEAIYLTVYFIGRL